jgi:hypothetical protein
MAVERGDRCTRRQARDVEADPTTETLSRYAATPPMGMT